LGGRVPLLLERAARASSPVGPVAALLGIVLPEARVARDRPGVAWGLLIVVLVIRAVSAEALVERLVTAGSDYRREGFLIVLFTGRWSDVLGLGEQVSIVCLGLLRLRLRWWCRQPV
jgi:hypothetical protein